VADQQEPAPWKLTKAETERRIFNALAPLLNWLIVPGSVQQPAPRHPDIRCDVVGIGPLAVELVSIDAPDAHMRMNNMSGTRAAWDQAMVRWPEPVRQRLLSELRDTQMSVFFTNQTGTRDRSKILYDLQAFLMSHPRFSGEITADYLGFPQGLHHVVVRQFAGFAHGPEVTAPSGDWLRPPQVDKIIEKLRDKSYDSAGAPCELFAYSRYDEPDGAVGWLESIQEAVATHLPGSKFRRVHLFHLGFLRHIYTMSAP
jgi:hypothetical protein